MKTRIKRAALAAIAALGVIVAACGGSTPSPSTDGGALPTARIAIWSGPEAENLRKAAAVYTQQTGNAIEIEEIARDGYADKLKLDIVGGAADYDAVYASADWAPAFIAADGLKPLDEFIANNAAPFLDTANLKPGIDNLTFDGKVYGFPSEGDTAWLFYRKDLLEAAGIAVPTTMDELLAAAKSLTTADRYGLVIGAVKEEIWWDFMHYFFAFGAELYDPTTYEVTANSEQAVAALTFYADLLRKHKVVSPDVTTYGYSGIQTALTEDKAAMGVEWMAATGDLTDCAKSPLICDKIAYTFVPAAVKGEWGFGGSSWGWMIPSTAANAEAGYKFIEWLVGGDGAKEWALNGGIPSNTVALADSAVVAKVPQFELLAEAMPYRHITPITTVSDQFVTAMVDAASAAIAGSKSPQEALDAAAAAIEAALKDGGYIK
ncbi:MAG: ABC transporter substrate-binding protein [Steroidobacteraceae bacterium]